jgi:2-dehydropantoate 2-reductase
VKRKAIAESGLTIITDENEITVFPNIVSDPLTIGKLDYLICATNI